MWRQCCAGDFSFVERTLNQERMRSSLIHKSVGLENGDAILSDDEGAEDNTAGAAAISSDAMDVEVEPRAYVAPVIDADGFETVVRRSKRISAKTPK
jgi:hypothetical protein